jgi:hypothetical protein
MKSVLTNQLRLQNKLFLMNVLNSEGTVPLLFINLFPRNISYFQNKI